MTTGDQPLTDLAATQHGVITAAQALALGMTRRGISWRCEAGEWRAIAAGTYLIGATCHPPSWAELSFETRLHAARLFHGPDALAVLDTAARVYGLEGLPYGDGTIHLALAPGRERHQQPGVRLHTWKLDPGDATVADGVPVTSIVRTLADLVRTSGRAVAVSLLDSALNQKRLDVAELDEVERRLIGRRGALAARKHLAVANGLAQSPLETRLRLIATDAGLAPHHLQFPVLDRYGVILGYGDMAWIRPGRRVLIVEADGRGPHESPQALFRDRLRANDFVTTDEVDMIRFTWEDTRRAGYVLSVLRRNLAHS